MSYTPTKWVNGVTPLNAQNMNHIEDGVKGVEFDVNDTSTMLTSNSIINAMSLEEGSIFNPPDNGYLYMYISGVATGYYSIGPVLDSLQINLQRLSNLSTYHTFLVPVIKGVPVRLSYSSTFTPTVSESRVIFFYAKKV